MDALKYLCFAFLEVLTDAVFGRLLLSREFKILLDRHNNRLLKCSTLVPVPSSPLTTARQLVALLKIVSVQAARELMVLDSNSSRIQMYLMY